MHTSEVLGLSFEWKGQSLKSKGPRSMSDANVQTRRSLDKVKPKFGAQYHFTGNGHSTVLQDGQFAALKKREYFWKFQ